MLDPVLPDDCELLLGAVILVWLVLDPVLPEDCVLPESVAPVCVVLDPVLPDDCELLESVVLVWVVLDPMVPVGCAALDPVLLVSVVLDALSVAEVLDAEAVEGCVVSDVVVGAIDVVVGVVDIVELSEDEGDAPVADEIVPEEVDGNTSVVSRDVVV